MNCRSNTGIYIKMPFFTHNSQIENQNSKWHKITAQMYNFSFIKEIIL
jgi:hypothetical protein